LATTTRGLSNDGAFRQWQTLLAGLGIQIRKEFTE